VPPSVVAPPQATLEKVAGQLPTVSVIVPVHRWDHAFTQCLHALLKLRPRPREIIIVSDGPVPGLASLEGMDRLTIHTTDTRRGPAAARNAGARLAGGDILFFLDSDVVAPGDIVGRVAKLFAARSDLDAVIGSYDDQPSESNLLSQYKNLAHHWVHQHARTRASTFWTGCGAVRREAFMRVGGFAPSYCRPCIEDIEFGYRLNQHGGTIGVDKSLQVKHLKRWDAASLLRSDFFDRAIPWSELILQRGGFVNDLNLSHANRLSVALSLLLAVALPAGLFYPGAWPVAAMAVVGLLVLNAELLRFFWRRRGTAFALRVIPWHWFQFVYSGAAFGWVAARTLLQRLRALGQRSRRSFTQPTAAPAPGRQDPAPAALVDELVSVVVPAYNAQDTIADCLRSLAAQEDARQLQVIVVDSSQDRTAAIVAEQFPWVELVRHAHRQDPGRARNQGLAAAKGAVVAFIDADCRAHPRWVQRLQQAHARGRPVVGGAVDMAEGSSLVGRAYYYCLFGPWLPGGRPGWVSDQPTANLSFDRRTLDRLGPFLDRGLCSDSQMQWRLAVLGLRTWFAPEIKVWHHNPHELGRLIGHRFRHGRAYASRRVQHWDWGRGRRWTYVALSPLIMLKLLVERLAQVAARPARLRELLPCLPLVVLGLFCWTVGEAQGYGQPWGDS